MALVVAAGVACVGAGLLLLRSEEKPVKTLALDEIVVLRTPGGVLEVSHLIRNEEFRWKTSYECPVIDCSALMKPTISEIRVPVHYVYRIPLAQSWTLQRRGEGYVLKVPGVQPSMPPTVDLSRMELKTSKGWLSPGAQGNRESLLRNLVPELSARASQAHYIEAQRAQATKTVQEFAAKWMREQKGGGGLTEGAIRVEFDPTAQTLPAAANP